MLAFRETTVTKSAVMRQLRAHAKADAIIKGRYWGDGKGCAVGCTIHGSNHAEYEPRFGIPQMLARLEDTIFEGLPNAKAKEWPVQFMSAVKPGADLSRVGWQFLHWLLTDEKVNPGINHPLVRDAVKQCADVLVPLTKGEPVNETAAYSAADAAAYSAADAAAYSAADAAAYSARSAADAAYSAADAADAAADAAYSAADAAYSARSAADAAADAAYSAYVRMAKKLLELIAAAPVVT